MEVGSRPRSLLGSREAAGNPRGGSHGQSLCMERAAILVHARSRGYDGCVITESSPAGPARPRPLAAAGGIGGASSPRRSTMNRTLLRRIAIATVVARRAAGGRRRDLHGPLRRQPLPAADHRRGAGAHRPRAEVRRRSLAVAVPRIAVKLPATTLSEPGRERDVSRASSAQASVALLPLLRGQFAVDGVRIDGLQATMVGQKDGRTSVDDLLQPPKPAADAGSPRLPRPRARPPSAPFGSRTPTSPGATSRRVARCA